jgi:hypothetical protein
MTLPYADSVFMEWRLYPYTSVSNSDPGRRTNADPDPGHTLASQKVGF